MGDCIHVRIDERGPFGKESGQHRAKGTQQVLVVTYSNQSHYCVGCPGDEPESNDAKDDGGQLHLLLVLVLARLYAARRNDHVQNVRVTVGDGDKGYTPGEHKVTEHEYARVLVIGQVIKAAAGEESFRYVAAVYLQQRNTGEEQGVEPAEEDHKTGLYMCRQSVRIQRIHYNIEPIYGDGCQRRDGQCSRERTHESVCLASCVGDKTTADESV